MIYLQSLCLLKIHFLSQTWFSLLLSLMTRKERELLDFGWREIKSQLISIPTMKNSWYWCQRISFHKKSFFMVFSSLPLAWNGVKNIANACIFVWSCQKFVRATRNASIRLVEKTKRDSGFLDKIYCAYTHKSMWISIEIIYIYIGYLTFFFAIWAFNGQNDGQLSVIC